MYTKFKNRAQHVLQQVKQHRKPRAIKLAGDITDTVQLLRYSGLCGVHARNPTIAIYAASSTVIMRAQDVRYTTSVGEEVSLGAVCFMNVEDGMSSMNANGTTLGGKYKLPYYITDGLQSAVSNLYVFRYYLYACANLVQDCCIRPL